MNTKGLLLMNDEFKQVIYKKYNVIGHLEFKQFDLDFLKLEEYLQSRKKESFSPNDRIIIEHCDTDFYADVSEFGFNLFNLFTAFRRADFPFFTILLFTNHFGIDAEIKKIVTDTDDYPTIIESFITVPHYSNNYYDVEVDVNLIEKHAVCMMSASRSHRVALFNFLNENKLLDKIAVSYNVPHTGVPDVA